MCEYDVLWSGIVRHALRNAVLPCMTLMATNLSGLVCGSFAIETIFSWNGIGTVILVLAEPCRIISRELLYTALTRQVDKIIILYNEEAYHLMKYASEMSSEIAKRFTDLFADAFPDDQGVHRPQITKVENVFFDERLIHKTARGELVRSKSEVIIADALYYNGLAYEYEPVLVLEGKVKRPDFKITDADTGEEWYWEHCGMMSDAKYAKRWYDKEKFYAKHGIVRGENLIVTEEYASEGLDSQKINELIRDVFM